MQNIVLALHLIIALLLIVAVLMQRSEGGGLGIGGGGNMKAAEGGLDGIQKFTWALGAAFVATSITLTLLAAGDGGASSLLDQLDGTSGGSVESAPVESDESPADPLAPADTTAPAADATGEPADPAAN